MHRIILFLSHRLVNSSIGKKRLLLDYILRKPTWRLSLPICKKRKFLPTAYNTKLTSSKIKIGNVSGWITSTPFSSVSVYGYAQAGEIFRTQQRSILCLTLGWHLVPAHIRQLRFA